MSRLPAAAFAALVAATVGAFFITQHLKVQNPFVNGAPRPDPPAINPTAGRVCRDLVGRRVSFKRTSVSFYLQTKAQIVDVFVYNANGQQVATATGSGRYVRRGPRVVYSWDGTLPSGGIAPDGSYHFEVNLPSEDETIRAGGDFQVITTPPHPQVTSVTLNGAPKDATAAGPPVISPESGQSVTIHYTPGNWRDSRIEIIRTDLPGSPRVVYSYGAAATLGRAGWDGKIGGRPAPAGTYLVGMRVTDQACNVGHFPFVSDPLPGSTPHAGVTVRYLAAQPPLVPVTAGSATTVFVDSRRRPYTWKLFAAGLPKVLERGSVAATVAATVTGAELRVKIPALGAGVYELALSSGTHHTVVPLVAAAGGRRAAAKVLVVLPALTWQGRNPRDDTGDGLPTTLTAGDQIELARPLVDGLPADLPGELGAIHFLERQRDPFQLTTDIALAAGVGPQLAGHTGVILDGSLVWLPSSLTARLRAFATAGGRVVSVGTDSMQRVAPVHVGTGGVAVSAGPPSPLEPDPFGARHGALVARTSAQILVLPGRLGVFGGLPAISGFSSYQPIYPPSGVPAAGFGIATGVPAVTGFRIGHGTVVEIGLPGFGASLAGNLDAQQLLATLWGLLAR